MSDLPWNRFQPDPVPVEEQEELPYKPPAEPAPDPAQEYVPPPPKPIPETDPADVKDLARDLLAEAMGYAKGTISAVIKGQDVDITHPTVIAETSTGAPTGCLRT